MGHWFKHDSDASEDEKLLTLKATFGKAGLCDWWTLCEVLSSKANAKYPKKFILGLTKKLELTEKELDAFIEELLRLELLVEEEGFLFSKSMVARLEEYEATKERNRQKKLGQRKDKKELVEGQTGDIEGTNEGQGGEIEGDASNSNSISNSRSESNNKKENSTNSDYKLLIDEILLENAKLDYARTDGLQADDVELGFKYLEGHFSKPEKLHQSTSRAQYTALVTWVKQEVLEEKTKVARLKKANDSPKTFFEQEQEARAKAEATEKKKRQELLMRKQMEAGISATR